MRYMIIALALACVTPACTIHATAKAPSANVLANRKIPGSVAVSVAGVSDEDTCSSTAGLKDFCVADMKSALHGGLTETLSTFFEGAGPNHAAQFKVVEFSHEYASATGEGVAPAVRVTMKWQLVIEGGAEKLQFTGRTEGPKPLVNTRQADSAVEALLAAVIEDIGGQLNAKSSK